MSVLEKPSLFQRAKLGLAVRIAPVREVKIALVDKVNLELQPASSRLIEVRLNEASVGEISIPALEEPAVTDFLAVVRPDQFECRPLPSGCNFEDLTDFLTQQLSVPQIESFDLALIKPQRVGKLYSSQNLLGEEIYSEGAFEKSKKKTERDNFAKRKTVRSKERAIPAFDVFDLILPILLPPISDSLDSSLVLPYPLKPWQFEGVKFLAENERCLLGDEMGLGKTIQTIVALRLMFHKGRMSSALILCPKSILRNWQRELWKWAPELRTVLVRGTKDQRELAWKSPSHIYLATYESLRQDLSRSLAGEYALASQNDVARKEYDCIILDEIQKIKNPTADVSKAVRLLDISIRWGLSGTPLENHVDELVSIFAYLKPGLLSDFDSFDLESLKHKIKPYFLRRKADGLPGMPAIEHITTWLELTQGQRDAYDRAEREGIVDLKERGESASIHHVLALITKLKQICNLDPATGASCKLDHLIELLDEICGSGDKALIFSQYPEKTLRAISDQLAEFDPMIFDGSLSDTARDKIVSDFQQRDKNKILLMSVKAGGVGLTLTRASHVVHFDQWWNPSVMAQAEGRVRRIGQQKSTVFVTSLMTIETIEERIHALLEGKRLLFNSVIDEMSDADLLKVMTEDELFGLFGIKKLASSALHTLLQSEQNVQALSSDLWIDTLASLSARDFEKLIAHLFEKMGFSTKLMQQTRDGGVDIVARRMSQGGSENLAIQCKHYPLGTVGEKYARDLYGVISAEQQFTRGLLVTSGAFSDDCRRFADGRRIDLFDGAYVLGLVKRYGA